MKEIFGKIAQAIVWIAFWIAFSCIGFASDKPGVMVPIMALIFVIAVGGILYNLSRNKRHSYDKLSSPVYINLIGGGVLLIFSLFFPLLSFDNFLPAGLVSKNLIFFFTIILSTIGFGGVYMINVVGLKNKIFSVIGFLAIIIATSIPALAIAQIDSSFGTLGTIYLTMLVQAILVWAGFSMFYKKFASQDE